MMLPHSFFDWWFAPWTYALDAVAKMPLALDRLGQRDAYRIWCRQASVIADLPARFDPVWHTAAVSTGHELTAAARLFAGLIAAREHNQAALGKLAFAERKWCFSIAATQPLRGSPRLSYDAGDAIEVGGLVELTRRLEPDFPGLWSRLRLMLAPTLAAKVDGLLQEALAAAQPAETSAIRAQRCWMLCRGHASSIGTAVAHTAA